MCSKKRCLFLQTDAIARFPSQNAGIVILLHRSVFIFKKLVYPSADFNMFCNNKTFPTVIDEIKTV